MEYALKINNRYNISYTDLSSLGYKPVHEGIIPIEYDNNTMELKKEIVQREDGDYEYKYTTFYSNFKINESINKYKQQLSNTDYKVIKNMEAQLVNEELPYDSVILHSERQLLRDKINELEELLKK